jgi:hypothetical protein
LILANRSASSNSPTLEGIDLSDRRTFIIQVGITAADAGTRTRLVAVGQSCRADVRQIPDFTSWNGSRIAGGWFEAVCIIKVSMLLQAVVRSRLNGSATIPNYRAPCRS